MRAFPGTQEVGILSLTPRSAEFLPSLGPRGHSFGWTFGRSVLGRNPEVLIQTQTRTTRRPGSSPGGFSLWSVSSLLLSPGDPQGASPL